MKLKIKNIGAIKDVELNLNRVNVIMGPQSAGKSTIAKIISFCLWLDKEMLISADEYKVDHNFLQKHLFSFYGMGNYLVEDSYIYFEGNIITFEYSNNNVKLVKNEDIINCKLSKIAYIPAERILLSLPNIFSLKLPHSSISNFIFDWFSLQNKFRSGEEVLLSDLSIKYFYDDYEHRDKVLLENGKQLYMSEVSSGLQSIIPLYVSVKYLTDWIYKNEDEISVEKRMRINKSQSQLLTQNRYIHSSDNDKALMLNHISKPQFAQIIIEEPELNLFPQTQMTLMYNLLSMLNREQDCIVLTTHSPYILYALNNCMLAWMVKDKVANYNLSLSSSSFINPCSVSVWELQNGYFVTETGNSQHTIQDEDGLIRDNYFDKAMNTIMADFTDLMNEYITLKNA